MKLVLFAWFIVFTAYCGLLLIEGLLVGGDLWVSFISLLAGASLLAVFLAMFAVFPHAFYMPLFIGIGTQLVFIGVGSYLRELEFYFFVMFLLVGVVAILKNFKLKVEIMPRRIKFFAPPGMDFADYSDRAYKSPGGAESEAARG